MLRRRAVFLVEPGSGEEYHVCMGLNGKLRTKIKRQAQQSDPFQEAIDYGIDVQMLIDNLKRTPSQRVRRHQIALDTVKMLQKARRL